MIHREQGKLYAQVQVQLSPMIHQDFQVTQHIDNGPTPFATWTRVVVSGRGAHVTDWMLVGTASRATGALALAQELVSDPMIVLHWQVS